MKYRIVRKKGLYYPQYRRRLVWHNYYEHYEGARFLEGFSDLSLASKWLKRQMMVDGTLAPPTPPDTIYDYNPTTDEFEEDREW